MCADDPGAGDPSAGAHAKEVVVGEETVVEYNAQWLVLACDQHTLLRLRCPTRLLSPRPAKNIDSLCGKIKKVNCFLCRFRINS